MNRDTAQQEGVIDRYRRKLPRRIDVKSPEDWAAKRAIYMLYLHGYITAHTTCNCPDRMERTNTRDNKSGTSVS